MMWTMIVLLLLLLSSLPLLVEQFGRMRFRCHPISHWNTTECDTNATNKFPVKLSNITRDMNMDGIAEKNLSHSPCPRAPSLTRDKLIPRSEWNRKKQKEN